MRPGRVFYFGMVNTPAYCASRGLDLYVGAAAGKMMGVLLALRSVGLRAWLVTLPILNGRASPGLQAAGVGRDIPSFHLGSCRSPWLRRAWGAVGFLRFSLSRVRSHDRVIVYNHALEYLPALIVLALRGVVVFHDIEDLPRRDERGIRGLFNRLGFWVTHRLTSSRKLVASCQIGERVNIPRYLPVYGLFSGQPAFNASHSKWSNLSEGQPLRVHYGGTLAQETGLDLFLAAVQILSRGEVQDGPAVTLCVTGAGDLDRIREVGSSLAGGRLQLEVYNAVSREAYLELLGSCHASLALKLSTSSLASTTFPSKVIEIASHGLALVSTRVSDVPLIFDEGAAFLLESESPEALAGLLQTMSRSPAEVVRRAEAGHRLVRERFSDRVVGDALNRFLETGGCPASDNPRA